MKKTTKVLIAAIAGITLVGGLVVAGVSGYFIGRRYERGSVDRQIDLAEEKLRRIGEAGQGRIEDRVFGSAHMNGPRALELEGNSLAGIVLEVEQNGETWLVVMPPGIDENVWKVQVTSETKIMKGAESVEVDTIEEGDRVMAIGKKNTDESTLVAEVINVME